MPAPAPIELPPVMSFRQAGGDANGWSDHYGAIQTAAAYAGLALARRYFLKGFWHHGCIGPWYNFSPGVLSLETADARRMALLVARQDQADVLLANGYARARAIGLPWLYVPEPDVSRLPRSLLVVPTHSLVGDQTADRTLFERYAEEIRQVAPRFGRVVICVHPNCVRNGLWVKEFSALGFEVVVGAQTNDANALLRMKTLFARFETVTTNGWGSHVAYALEQGARVSIHGTRVERSREDHLRDHAWAANPAALEQALASDTRREEDKFVQSLCVPPVAAVSNRDLGRWIVGAEHRVSPAVMKEVLRDLLDPDLTVLTETPPPVPAAPAASRTLFVVPDAADSEVTRQRLAFLQWLRLERTQDFEVLLLRRGPLEGEFVALAAVHLPDEITARAGWPRSFDLIHVGRADLGESIREWFGSDVPVVTQVGEQDLEPSALAARRWATDLQVSRCYVTDDAGLADRLRSMFRLSPERVVTIPACADFAAQAAVLDAARRMPASGQGQSLAEIYAGWNLAEAPQRPYIAAHLARAEARREARIRLQSGQSREAVQLLVGAVSRDLASQNPVIILESLLEIAADLAAMSPRQAMTLTAKAEEVAGKTGLSLPAFRRTVVESSALRPAA